MRIGVIIIVLFALACQPTSSEYKRINEKVEFKYHQFGDGQLPKIGEYIETYLTITDTLGDTLHYVPDYPYFIKLQNTALDSAWCKMKVGDSLSFKLSRKEVNRFYAFFKVMESDEGSLIMHARLNGVYDSSKVQQIEQERLSLRELEEQKALGLLMKELSISEATIDTIDGLYRIMTNKVNEKADTVKFGSEVSIHYKGIFLNGYIFDDTYKKGITPTFTFGKEYQMIEGVKLGIYGLKVGEKAKIILPSRRAFGEEGSLAGIVPPYTAVIFEIEIIKVIN